VTTTVSLFCGAGGESAGKELAFRQLGIDTTGWVSHAVNHWDLAVATHGQNFPGVHVHQEDITEVTARDFGLTHIDMLWASPSCVHHSRARGGKPKDDQQRSHADEVVDRWLRVANVDVLLIENVPEFADWGPLNDEGQPIKERKGEFFRAFLGKLTALGYRHEWRILCAADYGDPTTRRRFFLQAAKDGRGVHWPEPTHRDPKKGADMFTGHLPTWRTAAECIDWSIPVPSIFDRKRPLADATMRRIAAGVERYVLRGRPFIVNLTHGGRLENIDEPLKTVTTANRGEKAICAAFIQHYYGQGGQHQDPADPLHTVTTLARHGLVTVEIDGETYVITDIGMRMLEPKELARAMGFPEDFRWLGHGGKPLTKRDQVKMIGNACPVNTVSALIKAVVLERTSTFNLDYEVA